MNFFSLAARSFFFLSFSILDSFFLYPVRLLASIVISVPLFSFVSSDLIVVVIIIVVIINHYYQHHTSVFLPVIYPWCFTSFF